MAARITKRPFAVQIVLPAWGSLRVSLKDLECPLCTDLMFAGICLCPNGHSFCVKCRTKIRMCGICRSPLTGTSRNYHMEELVKGLILECKYESRGCPQRPKLIDFKDHDQSCDFRPVLCTAPLFCRSNMKICHQKDSMVNYKDFLDHLVDHHDVSTEKVFVKEAELAGRAPGGQSTSIFVSMKRFFNEAFVLQVSLDVKKNFCFCVVHMGLAENSNKYACEINFSYNPADEGGKGISHKIPLDEIFHFRKVLADGGPVLHSKRLTKELAVPTGQSERRNAEADSSYGYSFDISFAVTMKAGGSNNNE